MSEDFSNHSILVVDDEVLLVNLIDMQLQEIGIKVLKASNGKEAIEILEKNSDISLIISDIKMPIMDGITMLKTIRSRGSLVPVVFFSAFGDPVTMRKAWQAGAFDFFEKPIKQEELITKVKLALAFGKECLLGGALSATEKKTESFTINKAVIDNFKNHCQTKSLNPNEVIESLLTRYLASGT